MSKVIPNTFMCFNVYVDRAMHQLTDSELRVLVYATRHILGWQDKIADRRGHISISMFTGGFATTGEDGTTSVYAGCGLGEGAVRSACHSLCEFGLLVKVGYPSEKGQEWQIGEAPRWELLEARTAERAIKQKLQVEKATQVGNVRRKGVTLNDTPSPTSNDTPPVSLDDTPPLTLNDTKGVTLNDTQTKPCTKPIQSHEQKEITPSVDSLIDLPVAMPTDPDVRGQLFDQATKALADKFNANEPPTWTEAQLQENIRQMYAKYGNGQRA